MKRLFVFIFLTVVHNIVQAQPLTPISAQAFSVNFAYSTAIQSFTVPPTLCVPVVTVVL